MTTIEEKMGIPPKRVQLIAKDVIECVRKYAMRADYQHNDALTELASKYNGIELAFAAHSYYSNLEAHANLEMGMLRRIARAITYKRDLYRNCAVRDIETWTLKRGVE